MTEACRVRDYLDGAESDSGYLTEVQCAECGLAHRVTASNIGWFAYSCGPTVVIGRVPGWKHPGRKEKQA